MYENGALLWEAGQPERARELFERALSLSEQLHNAFGIAKVNNGLGVLAMSLGDSPQARKCFEASIAHSTEHRRIEDLVVAQTNLAELFHCIGYFKKALLLLNQSITESLRFRYDQGVSIALRHSSILLIDLGRYTEAQEQAQSALELNRTQHNQQEYLASLVVWLRCHFSSGNWHQVDDTLEEALKLLPSYDSEGYSPIVLSWKARMVMHLHQDTTTARFLLRTTLPTRSTKIVNSRSSLFIKYCSSWKAVNGIKLSIQFAEKALAIANQCGYRYYAMRSRQLLSTIVSDPTQQKRHANIAQSLTRSLASSLSKSDADSFLSPQYDSMSTFTGPPMPGDKIGHYTLLESIGLGGNATVFRAHSEQFGIVAVKVLHPGKLTEVEIKRFYREFEAMRRLNHPNIITVYEIGKHGSYPWLSMESNHRWRSKNRSFKME